jgi:RNA recognition motif-containing protein
VDLFHDRRTRVSKGCGFVSMATREAAAAAMEALDDKLALEGATAPLAVKWADPDLQYKKRKATASGNAENRMVRAANEEGWRLAGGKWQRWAGWLAPGQALDARDLLPARTCTCFCCTVLSSVKSWLLRACCTGGICLPFPPPHPPPSTHLSPAPRCPAVSPAMQLFFAKVLRTAGEEDVRQLFCQFGPVCEVNMFRAFQVRAGTHVLWWPCSCYHVRCCLCVPHLYVHHACLCISLSLKFCWVLGASSLPVPPPSLPTPQGAPTTKGCGLITMGSNEAAVAAIQALDGRYTWGGMDAPMVVKWMDVALQKRRREEHLLALRHGLARVGACGDKCVGPGKAEGKRGMYCQNRAGQSGARRAAGCKGWRRTMQYCVLMPYCPCEHMAVCISGMTIPCCMSGLLLVVALQAAAAWWRRARWTRRRCCAPWCP